MKTKTLAITLLLFVASAAATHGYSTSPDISDEKPVNNSVIEKTSQELQKDTVLSVNASDPAGGPVNVSFFNASSNSLILENTTGGPQFTANWSVDSYGNYSWYVEAEDNSTNVSKGYYEFEVEPADTTGPSITLDTSPSGNISDKTPLFEGTTSEKAKVSYRVDGGSYQEVTNGWETSFSFETSTLSQGKHTVTIKARDQADNTNTREVEFEIDSTGPSITIDTQPTGTVKDRTPLFEGDTSEQSKVSYRVDGGTYKSVTNGWKKSFSFETDSLSNGEHTVEIRAEDKAGNFGTESIDFEIADGSEVTFDVNVDNSYPNSGIPIDPDSSLYPQDTNVDFNFTLEANGNVIDISNGYQDGICDFYGDDGWHLGNDYYCGTEVPPDIDLGTYDLVAEWELRGETHRRILDDSFPIEEPGDWYSTQQSHGGRVEGDVNLNTEFTNSYQERNGKIYTCEGNTFQVNNIQQVTARCSNGVTSTSTPPVVSWVYRNGQKISTNNNDMFNDASCQIGSGITRQQIYGQVGNHKDEGYLPENCNLKWQLGGDSSFTVDTLDQSGNYEIFVDYVNALSNSPDYVCPARTDNNDLCSIGELSGDEHGWENVKKKEVKVVDPSGSVMDTSFSGNTLKERVGDTTYLRREDYTGDITGTIEFKNTGTGEINVQDLSLDCPSGVSCNLLTSVPLTVTEGDEIAITWTADMSGRTKGPLDVELKYDDNYGLDCTPQQTVTWNYYIDEEDPETGEVVN